MKTTLAMAAALLFAASTLGAAEQTLTGTISDSMCKAKHESGAEGQEVNSAAECTMSCVKGGSKFVLLVGDKVYSIANQNNPDLPKFAGQMVKMTGEVNGDALTVSKIESAK